MTIRADKALAEKSYHDFLMMAWEHANERVRFVDNWHIRQMCADVEALTSFELTKLVQCVPPGSGKSSVFCVFWAPWVWATRSPSMHFMRASFDLSLLNNASEKMITLINSPWYRARWPHVRLASDAHRETKTTEGGACYNTTFLGGGTGRHAHYQVIDDPIKPKDVAGGSLVSSTVLEHAWRTIHDTLSSRYKERARFSRVLVMQRLHEDDPAGRAIKEDWTPRIYPLVFDANNADPKDARTVDGATALQEKRYEDIPPEAMLTPRAGMVDAATITDAGGSATFYTQYQQLPATPGGEIIKDAWITPYTYNPEALLATKPIGVWAQSWDFAFKKTETSDNVSGGHWLGCYERSAKTQKLVPHYYLMPAPYLQRASFSECIAVMIDKFDAWPSSEIYVEDKANGTAIEDHLRVRLGHKIKLVEPRGGKVVRLTARTALFEGGQVHLPEGPDLKRIQTTLTRFPNVKFDDEVDMISQALGEMNRSALFVAAMDRAKTIFDGKSTSGPFSPFFRR